jgi:hypothetical protein
MGVGLMMLRQFSRPTLCAQKHKNT